MRTRNPNWEYWDDKTIQKSQLTWLHGFIQKLLTRLLDDLGCESASEVTLKLHFRYHPVPDVIAMDDPKEQPIPPSPLS